MLIDWFTVGAQALNFIALVWLLKRFLYRPVLDAIDAREARIAAQIADAQAQQASARTEREDFQRQNEALQQQRASLLEAARTEAAAERERLLTAARQAADALSASRQLALRQDAGHLQQVLGVRVRQEVFAVARQALADLADASLEERIGDIFLRRLHSLDAAAQASMQAALLASSGQAQVRSVVELPAAQRDAIQRALKDVFAVDVSLRFVTAPELVSGVELVAGGQKLAWSVSHYLSALEASVDAMCDAAVPEAAARTEPGVPSAAADAP